MRAAWAPAARFCSSPRQFSTGSGRFQRAAIGRRSSISGFRTPRRVATRSKRGGRPLSGQMGSGRAGRGRRRGSAGLRGAVRCDAGRSAGGHILDHGSLPPQFVARIKRRASPGSQPSRPFAKRRRRRRAPMWSSPRDGSRRPMGGSRPALAERQAVGLLSLLPAVADAVDIPVVAAGGVADGRGIAAALDSGASATQIGTAFLRCPEAKIHAAWADAIGRTLPEDTMVSRAFSGRAGRSVATDYAIAATGPAAPAPAPYPVQRGLTSRMREDALAKGDLQRMQAWAGQSAASARGTGSRDRHAALARGAGAHRLTRFQSAMPAGDATRRRAPGLPPGSSMRGLRPVVGPEDRVGDRGPGCRGDEDVIEGHEWNRFRSEGETPLPRSDDRRNDHRPDAGERKAVGKNVARLPSSSEAARARRNRAPQRIEREDRPKERAHHRAGDEESLLPPPGAARVRAPMRAARANGR